MDLDENKSKLKEHSQFLEDFMKKNSIFLKKEDF